MDAKIRINSKKTKGFYNMKISTFLKPFSFLPALALMYLIYTFSAQPGEASSMMSYKVSEGLVRTVNKVTMQGWDEWTIQSYAGQVNGIVRKGAHVTEYFLLAVAVSFPLYVYGVRGILLMLLAGGICVGYAFADEYHQSLVLGRSSSTRDVAIDSIGVFFGVIFTRLIGWSGRMAITGPAYERRQNRREKELNEREEELERREEALRRRESRQAERPSRQREYRQTERTSDHTRVYGPVSDVDDRTRVFRTQRQQQQYEEQQRRASFERRRVQSQDLQDDNTSDQLSEDMPLSGLFGRRQDP